MTGVIRRLLPVPFVPLMTAAWVVGLFSIATAPLQDLWRPLGVSLGIAVLVGIAGALARPRDRWLAIGLGTGWLLVLGAWPLALAVVLVSAWRVAVDRVRRAGGRRPVREPGDRQVVRWAEALGAAAALVALVSLAGSGAVRIGGTVGAEPALEGGTSGPSIYLVLLDGYPATEVLAETFGFDNGPFLAELERRGFDVPAAPLANYNRTLLTLSSMLHMRHVADIPGLADPSEGYALQNRRLTAAISDAPVPRLLDGAGYETVSIGSPYGEATLTSVDRVVSTGALTLFEEQLVRYSAVGRWLIGLDPELVAGQHRLAVLEGVRRLGQVAEEGDGPRFVLAHLFSPHPPFVFARDGSHRPLAACYPWTCGMTTPEAGRLGMDLEEYGAGLVGQVEYLNGLLLDAVDRIVAADPDAVIVLFSDHGARFSEGPSDEHFRIFLAARTPGHEGLLGRPRTLVNLFPTLLGAYFDARLPVAADDRHWSPDFAPLATEPFE